MAIIGPHVIVDTFLQHLAMRCPIVPRMLSIQSSLILNVVRATGLQCMAYLPL